MCFNIAVTATNTNVIASRYKKVLPEEYNVDSIPTAIEPYYFVSGFAHPALPVVKQDGIFLYEWGLIPFWIKDINAASDIKTKTLNAVGETVFEKPSFRKSILTQRCLLGINGFFEWRDVDGVKYPYYIHSTENEIFSLGCIYDSWVDQSTGEIINTFSMLTTPANPLMEKIHNLKKRMPLLINPTDESKWIDPTLSKEDIQSLIKPYDEKLMTAYTISRAANSPRTNRNIPEILEAVEYEGLL